MFAVVPDSDSPGRDNVSQSVPRDAFPYSAPSGLQLPWTGSDTVVGHHDAGKWQRPELQTPSHGSKWMPPALSVSSSAIFTSWQGHESAMPVKTLQRWFVLTWVCDKDPGTKLWVKPGLDGGCCRFAITNGRDSIPIWSLEKWADGSPAVSVIRAVVGEPFWIASAFQPSESLGQSTLPRPVFAALTFYLFLCCALS